MGYDIVTRLADRGKAEQFAKKYGYNYMFNKDNGTYEGDETPYFRANIWGMSNIRRVFDSLYVEGKVDGHTFATIMEKFSWNDGAHVTPSDCEFLIKMWDKDKAIDAVIMDVNAEMNEDPHFLKTKRYDEEKKEFVDHTATVDEVVNGRVNLCEEFVDYLGIAKELDGCLVY